MRSKVNRLLPMILAGVLAGAAAPFVDPEKYELRNRVVQGLRPKKLFKKKVRRVRKTTPEQAEKTRLRCVQRQSDYDKCIRNNL